MGAPVPEMNPDISVDEHSAEVFVSSLRTISPPERRKHASVYNYWLSIRRERQFPPIRDLDPLEISDAGPFSLLLEMIGGGEDADIRHIGHAIKGGIAVEKVGEAPHSSLLSCVGRRLPVVAACRDAFAFEDEFETNGGKQRCWVTLLPFSATGTWIDYVYGFVSLDGAPRAEELSEDTGEAETTFEEAVAEMTEQTPDDSLSVKFDDQPQSEVAEPFEDTAVPEPFEDTEVAESIADTEVPEPVEETVITESVEDVEVADDTAVALGPLDLEDVLEAEPVVEPEDSALPAKPSISERLLDKFSNVGGFYGRPVEIELDMETASLESWSEEEAPSDEPVASSEEPPSKAPPPTDEPASPPEPLNPVSEGTLQMKLTDVRAKADEARQAKLRANSALYQGLSAAYDFALDAEDSPEQYLKLVEAQGLKIQLRSPMTPVVKLAFNGLCDDTTIAQLEAVLAWALDRNLPRGGLAEQIEAAGGIARILSGDAEGA
jgi:hypothetical protein